MEWSGVECITRYLPIFVFKFFLVQLAKYKKKSKIGYGQQGKFYVQFILLLLGKGSHPKKINLSFEIFKIALTLFVFLYT